MSEIVKSIIYLLFNNINIVIYYESNSYMCFISRIKHFKLFKLHIQFFIILKQSKSEGVFMLKNKFLLRNNSSFMSTNCMLLESFKI